MKKYNQSGFSVVEILITIIVLVAIGGIGWFAYRHVKSTDTVSNTTRGQSNDSPSVVATTLSKGPQALYTAVTARLVGCKNVDGTPYTKEAYDVSKIHYVANRAAKVQGCDSFEYYSYDNGVWTFDFGGQDTALCSTYLQYKIPSALTNDGDGTTTGQCVGSDNTMSTYTLN